MLLYNEDHNPLWLKSSFGTRAVFMSNAHCYKMFFLMLRSNFPKGFIDIFIMVDEIMQVVGVIRSLLHKEFKRNKVSSWVYVSNMENETLMLAMRPYAEALVEFLHGKFSIVDYELGFKYYLDDINGRYVVN